MINSPIDIEQIRNLKDGESCIISDGFHNVAEIWKKYSLYFLFEFPMFEEDPPQFRDTYREGKEHKILEEIDNWT